MALLHLTPEDKPEGAPEWMVSFADMITIMMSFFVIMFALASGDKGKKDDKQQAVIESLEYRFGPKWNPLSSWGLMPGDSPVQNAGSKMKLRTPPVQEDPDGEMVRIRGKKKARIFVPRSGDSPAVGGAVYFDDASVELSEAQQQRLVEIATELAGKPQMIEILARASNRPLPEGAAQADRADLAYARCRNVAELLTDLKIEPQRLRLTVSRSGAPPGLHEAAPDSKLDTRLDVYLTDAIAEGFMKAKD